LVDVEAPPDFVQSAQTTLKFTRGSSSAMDRGHGLDLRNEMMFDDSISLSVGARASGLSRPRDYMLLQWKLSGD
jgi:hypothetical protein